MRIGVGADSMDGERRRRREDLLRRREQRRLHRDDLLRRLDELGERRARRRQSQEAPGVRAG